MPIEIFAKATLLLFMIEHRICIRGSLYWVGAAGLVAAVLSWLVGR